MKTNVRNSIFISIIVCVAFIFGIIIGLSNNQYQKKLNTYDKYQQVVEQLLDECDNVHNISDTVCEGDIYSEYMDLREELGLE